MDKIFLNNLKFYGFHGLLPEENRLGQPFHVDVELHLSLQKAGKTDDMNESVHYGEVYEVIQKIVEGRAKKLIEAVAEDIAITLLTTFTKIEACKIKVVKPKPPIAGQYDSVAVEIYREKSSI